MPIYSLDCRGSLVKRSFERSPAIALETNATSIDEIPCSVRSAADATILDAGLSGFLLHQVPQHMDGVLTWLEGETLLTGAPAAIRHDLHDPGRCVFVPVHVPGVDEIPFVTLQPRWFRAGRRHNYWNFNIRLQARQPHRPNFCKPCEPTLNHGLNYRVLFSPSAPVLELAPNC